MKKTIRLLLPLLLFSSAAAAPLQFIASTPAKPTTYEITEWSITTGRTYANPFNPDEISIDAVFTAPDKSQLTLPAFWYQPPDNSTPHFLLRFTPTMPGQWSVILTAKDSADTRTTQPRSFTVSPAQDNPGFARRTKNQNAGRYFTFDNGHTFFLLGLNLAWSPANDPADYDDWFRSLHKAGGNYARIWFNHAYPLESKKIPLGTYDLNAANFYDHVFQAASQNHIYLMLTLNNYRELIGGDFFGDADWPNSPYNARNGGPLQNPLDYFTNPQSLTLYHRRLRYLVARYSAFTSLAFWEFWNEQDHLPDPGLPTAWLQKQSEDLHALDPYHHLLTTSYSWKDRPPVWKLPLIDLTQRHMYGIGDIPDFTTAIQKNAAAYSLYNKPHLIGEFGINWKEPDLRHDPRGTGIALHNALWASALAGNSGAAATWWWDNYFIPKKLWPVFTGLSIFLSPIDLANKNFQPVELPHSRVLDELALQDTHTGETLLWLHDPASNWQNDLSQTPPTTITAPPLTLPLPKSPPKSFTAQWINTNTGQLIKEEKFTASTSLSLHIPIPDFQRDIALHLFSTP